MRVTYLKVFLWITVTLTLVYWVLGSLIVRDIIPTWFMLLANPPFGYVYVWTESLWQGEGYMIDERVVMVLQVGAHIAQIFLWYGTWLIWKWYRKKPVQLQKKNQPG